MPITHVIIIKATGIKMINTFETTHVFNHLVILIISS